MSKKNRRKIRKALATMLAALLLVVVSVGATIAYLTAEDEVVNTFTVGKVAITLDEAKVNLAGKPVDEEGNEVEYAAAPRVQENEYKLMPGHNYVKDPIVTVADESEESYIRMLVTVNDITKLQNAFGITGPVLLQDYVTGWDANTWVSTNEIVMNGNAATYEFRYFKTVSTVDKDTNTTVDATVYEKLPALFTNVVIPGDIDNENLEKLSGVEITVVAQAIQADGFGTADLAWAEWKD